MANIHQPPKRELFVNALSNTNECISELDYEQFVWSWTTLRCPNLLTLENLYCICDSTHLADLTIYHFTKLHQTTGLWGSNFLTISQMAMSAALFNCSNPTGEGERLRLQVVPEEAALEYDQAIFGGYSTG